MKNSLSLFATLLFATACSSGGSGGASAGGATSSAARVVTSPSQPSGPAPSTNGNRAPSIALADALSPSLSRQGELRLRLNASDPEGDPIAIRVSVSLAGAPFKPATVEGDLGFDTSGRDRRVSWDSLADAEHFRGQVRLQISAADKNTKGNPITVPLKLDNVAPAAAGITPRGSLSGRRIVVSPGHGWLYSASAWRTQRGVTNGLIEDMLNAEACLDVVIPVLEGMGAEVYSCRERSRCKAEVIVDNGDSRGYSERGSWASSSLAGFKDGKTRYASTNTQGESARAVFRPDLPLSTVYPVWLRFRASSNRASDMLVRVHHAGGLSIRRVDARRLDNRWIFVGEFPFRQGNQGSVTISNFSREAGKVVVADAVRFGAGTGSVRSNGAPRSSGKPRWEECGTNWINYVGCPTSVVPLSTKDFNGRTRYAGWMGGDAYISFHSNAGGGTGTSSFRRRSGMYRGSDKLQSAIHQELIRAVRENIHPSMSRPFDSAWRDRGMKTANFGELSSNARMPAVLVEVAFHDNSYDAGFEKDQRWRDLMYRGACKGIARYFKSNAVMPPFPPKATRASQSQGVVTLSWNNARDNIEPSANATDAWIQTSPDGFAWSAPISVSGGSKTFSNLLWGSTYYFRVRAKNAGGVSKPGETVKITLAPAP